MRFNQLLALRCLQACTQAPYFSNRLLLLSSMACIGYHVSLQDCKGRTVQRNALVSDSLHAETPVSLKSRKIRSLQASTWQTAPHKASPQTSTMLFKRRSTLVSGQAQQIFFLGERADAGASPAFTAGAGGSSGLLRDQSQPM